MLFSPGWPSFFISRIIPIKLSMKRPGLMPGARVIRSLAAWAASAKGRIPGCLNNSGSSSSSSSSFLPPRRFSSAIINSAFRDFSNSRLSTAFRRMRSPSIARLLHICVSRDMACFGGNSLADSSSFNPRPRTLSRAAHRCSKSPQSGICSIFSISPMSCPTASAISSAVHAGMSAPLPPSTDVRRMPSRSSWEYLRTSMSTICIAGGRRMLMANNTSSRMALNSLMVFASPFASAARLYAASAAKNPASIRSKRDLTAARSVFNVSSGMALAESPAV
mmetsp:Transcript_4096/g.7633  ORF Transcript_4096/g.7633 Transcript_4096/m.7633 type:complete len:278 (+) Transcript_4096:338-1171(+)